MQRIQVAQQCKHFINDKMDRWLERSLDSKESKEIFIEIEVNSISSDNYQII